MFDLVVTKHAESNKLTCRTNQLDDVVVAQHVIVDFPVEFKRQTDD